MNENCKIGDAKRSFLLFLIGMFSMTQIALVGKLGISEFGMVIAAPFVFAIEYHSFCKDRVIGFFYLILLWLAGAIFSDLYNENYLYLALRGIAVPIVVFSSCCCLYVLLRKNILNIKWYLLGAAVSAVITIFAFQRGGAGDLALYEGSEAAIERVLSYKLFWGDLASAWILLPMEGWYLSVPNWIACVATMGIALFYLSLGGRSSFMVLVVSLVLLLCAHKNGLAMRKLSRHLVVLGCILFLTLIGVKSIYKYAAVHGYMGDQELEKYERQVVDTNGSVLQTLMRGRGEIFIGTFAALERPIIGHGSQAIDTKGYYLEYLSKYGTDDELGLAVMKWAVKNDGIMHIPSHSHVVCYWLWHGVFGLIFWIYVIGLAVKTFFRRMSTVPALYGYLAISLPFFFWNVLFSPFGTRVNECALFAVMLLIRKINREQWQL